MEINEQELILKEGHMTNTMTKESRFIKMLSSSHFSKFKMPFPDPKTANSTALLNGKLLSTTGKICISDVKESQKALCEAIGLIIIL